MFIEPRKIFALANSDGDAIITSRLDCDVYKFVMGQFIWASGLGDVPVTFKLKIRTAGVQLGKIIPESALRAQLDALKNLMLTQTELSQLGGMTITSKAGVKRNMFSHDYIDVLAKTELYDYDLVYCDDGSIDLWFAGPWHNATWWETPGMAIISELYYWYLWKGRGISKSEFSAFYAELYKRTIASCVLLSQHPSVTFSQFGHRRRHSRMWEMIVQEVFDERIPNQCLAPSNVWLAFQMGQNNPRGTNAHELPMVWATLNDNSDAWIARSPYDMVEKWYVFYPELNVLLPDTFGSTAFFENAPRHIAEQTGIVRIDSKQEELAIPEIHRWFESNDIDPMTRGGLPSDGLTDHRMVEIAESKYGKHLGFLTHGWGTQATNNINGILPKESGFHTISMVIKIVEANGHPTVKLSDNPNKHTGEDLSEIARYKRIFSEKGARKRETIV